MGLLDQYKNQNPAPNNATPQARPLVQGQNTGNLLAGMSGKDPTEQFQYFLPGLYVAEIQKVSRVDTRKNETMIAVETIVVESTNEARSAGMKVSWTQKLTGVDLEMAHKNLVGFLMAAVNPQTEEDRAIVKANSGAIMLEACGGDDGSGPQTLKNKRVIVECIPYHTKKTDKDTTICNFRPVPAGK